jgi:hypothetical protein
MMDLDLPAWQQRLDAHFAELASRRKTAFPVRPIFALEHGLDHSEVESLSAALRLHVTKNAPTRDQTLLWVVYAAEVGYRYSGDEYWQTFQTETPGWVLNGDRYWLRNCFVNFCNKFGAAQPTGTWANHFSIICWPITHAILPRDLQRQLAHILYEIRHQYSTDVFESPQALGELIADRSWNTSSRFQNFVQETSLVGQIAAALLLEPESGAATGIFAKTLHRIRTDVDRERRAREWLRNARRFAEAGARIRALKPRAERAKPTALQTEQIQAEVAALGIEPRLMLRPADGSGSQWSVFCEIPDLSPLLLKFPDMRDVLTGSRCFVAGAARAPLARGQCLYGAQRIKLTRWPKSEEILLRFERSNPQLEYLLRTECLVRPGPLWLFRVASDGIAYELRSLKVRPNQRYILLHAKVPLPSDEHITPIELECADAYGAIFDVPAALPGNWEDTLRRLGLHQAKTIEVWPAGLAPAVWDAEACGTWLSSDQPRFALRPDHDVHAIALSLNGEANESPWELTSLAAGEPLFFEMPQLPVGMHKMNVAAYSRGEDKIQFATELQVVIHIREPRDWPSGLSPSGPLLVQVHPTVPTLEQLWEGEVDLIVNGPIGRTITSCISLYDTEGAPATLRKSLPPLPLPVSANDWRTHCDRYFRRADEVEQTFDDARFCELRLGAFELGEFLLRCEREFRPLRWSLRRSGSMRMIRLADDTGDNANPSISRITFDRPTAQTMLAFANEYEVPSFGGLYVAQKGKSIAAIVTPPTIRDFSDLACEPIIPQTQRVPESVEHALALAAFWAQGKLPGDVISAIRRREVLLTFAHYIAGLICGAKWAKAEIQAATGCRQSTLLRDTISKRAEHAEMGKRLEEACGEFANDDTQTRLAEFTFILADVGLLASKDDPEWICELALRLASDPGTVESWAGIKLHPGVKRLMETETTLARAARFVVLSIARDPNSEAVPNQLYKGWQWK